MAAVMEPDRSVMVDRALALGWKPADLYDPGDYVIDWATFESGTAAMERKTPSPPRLPLPEHLRIVTFKESRF